MLHLICSLMLIFGTNGKRLIDDHENARRLVDPLTVLAIIGTIAAATSTATDVIGAINIEDDGAKFYINNYFANVALRKEPHMQFIDENGYPLKAPSSPIPAAQEGANGGVFSDEGPPAGSAGISQWHIVDPQTGQIYCMAYYWSIDTPDNYQYVGYELNMVDNACGSATNDYRWFTDRKHGMDAGIVSQSGNDYVRGEWVLSNVQRAVHAQFQVFTDDLKIGLSAITAIPDGDHDHPTITLSVGPYKKIFGEALIGNWFIMDNTAGNTYFVNDRNSIGQYRSVTDCHLACRKTYGVSGGVNACNYFVYDIGNGYCARVSGAYGPSEAVSHHRFILLNNINYDQEYELLANHRECEGSDDYLGTFDTTDQCWNACKDKYNNECEFFIFGIKEKFGYCYRETECSAGRYEGNSYNVYRRCPDGKCAS